MVRWHFYLGFVSHAKRVAAFEERRDWEIPRLAETGGPEVRFPKFKHGEAGARDPQTLQKMKKSQELLTEETSAYIINEFKWSEIKVCFIK